jgi:hypothetical protein
VIKTLGVPATEGGRADPYIDDHVEHRTRGACHLLHSQVDPGGGRELPAVERLVQAS